MRLSNVVHCVVGNCVCTTTKTRCQSLCLMYFKQIVAKANNMNDIQQQTSDILTCKPTSFEESEPELNSNRLAFIKYGEITTCDVKNVFPILNHTKRQSEKKLF